MRLWEIYLTKIVVMLLLFGFIGIGLWRSSPLDVRNMFLSTLCDDFYAPVFEREFSVWEKGHQTITFSPRYYGEYELCVIVDGSMSDLAYPLKSMPGSFSVTVTQDGTLTEVKRNQIWKGDIGYKEGRTEYELFDFYVGEKVREVSVDFRIDEPLTYFKTRHNAYLVVKNSYTL